MKTSILPQCQRRQDPVSPSGPGLPPLRSEPSPAALPDRRLRREPTERMWRIHELLAAGKYPNCFALAAEFEVSHKTVKRDVDYMRDHFDLPIAYDPHRRGFYFTKAVSAFPGAPTITEAEMFALLVAHKATAQYQGAPFQKPLETAFRKLIGQLDNKQRYSIHGLHEALSFRPLAPEDPDVETLEIASRALNESRVLRFTYRKPGEKWAETREVRPYHLACIDNRWYLLGYDLNRRDIRKFVLGRLSDPVLTPERFSRPRDFDPEVYLRTGFGVMTGSGDYEVVIEFDPWAADVMRGRRWHWSQVVTELPGGGSRLAVRLGCLDEIEEWVLRWGSHATVLRPQELGERIAKTARDLAQRYAGVKRET